MPHRGASAWQRESIQRVLQFDQIVETAVAIGLLAVCVFVLGLLVFVGKGQVLGRLGGLAPGIRWNITKDCLRMFSHRPVWGWGLGTFPIVYPAFRTFYTNLFVNEAHNDYAQLLVETGLLGFVLMLWFLVFLYRYGLPGTSRRWEFRWDGVYSVPETTGVVLTDDFNPFEAIDAETQERVRRHALADLPDEVRTAVLAD